MLGLRLFILGVCLLGCGCAAVPFEKPILTPLGNLSDKAGVDRFQSRLAEQNNLMTTVAFKGWGKSFSALGLIKVNREQQRFLAVGLNQMGMKIFELAGDGDSLTRQYLLPQMPQQKILARAIAEDIRHLYLNWTPPAEAAKTQNRRTLVFQTPHQHGTITYTYGGQPLVLLSKRFFNADDRLMWKTAYYEYELQNDRLHPRGLVLDNYQYGYRLTVTVTDVR